MALALHSMPLTPGSLAACLSTADAAPTESPFNKPSILFRHASLCACLSWPVPRYRQPGRRSLLCERGSSLLCSPSALLLGLGHNFSGSLHSNLDVERIVTAIWGPESGTSQHNILASGGTLPLCGAPVQPPMSWPDRQRAPPHTR